MTASVIDARPVVAAIKAAITTAGVAFGDGVKPTVAADKPYIVGFFDTGTITDRSLRSRDGWSIVGTFHCSGLSPDAARIATRVLREAILGLHGQTIAGRQVKMPVHTPGPPMDRDDDADPPLFIQVDEWRLRLS